MASIIIKFKQGQRQVWHVVALQELSLDMKRVLTIQLKELLNEIEDCETDATSIGSVYVIGFLDDCYQAG